MMHTYSTTGMHFGSLFVVIHIFSVLSVVSGLALLLAWAIKTLPLERLRQWAVGLTVTGVVLCLIIALSGPGPRMKFQSFTTNGPQGIMMRGGNADMMSNMGMMLDGLSGDAFDEAFIRLMIPHHEGAIDMAQEAKKSAKHEELKRLADDIIDAQQREIDLMEGWLQDWGYEN